MPNLSEISNVLLDTHIALLPLLTFSLSSITMTSTPWRVKSIAADKPTGPAPTIITLWWLGFL